MDVGAGRQIGAVVPPRRQRQRLPVLTRNGVVLVNHRPGADAKLGAARGIVEQPVRLLAEFELVDLLRPGIRVGDELALGRLRPAQDDDAQGALEEVRGAQHWRAEGIGRLGDGTLQLAPQPGGERFQIRSGVGVHASCRRGRKQQLPTAV